MNNDNTSHETSHETSHDALQEVWLEQLTAPENINWFERLLGTFPPKILIDVFKMEFKEKYLAVQLLGKPLKRAKAEDILANVSKIVETRPAFVENVATWWLGMYFEQLEQNGNVPMTADGYHLLAWLWTQTPPELVETATWDFVSELVGQWQTALEHEQNQRAELQATHEQNLTKQAEKHQKEIDKLKRKLTTQKEAVEAEKKKTRDALQAKSNAERELGDEKQSHQETLTLYKNLQTQHNTSAQTIKDAKDRFEQSKKALQERADDAQRELHEVKRECDELAEQVALLETENSDLQDTCETLETEKNFASVPLDEDILSTALIIDYDALADAPQQRFIALLDTYAAFLNHETTDILPKVSNWYNLNEKRRWKPEGIFLLGLERLLLDGITLPIRRFMDTNIFKQECLLSAVTAPPTSSRLTSGSAEQL
jgi:hypothetical protein